MITTEILTDHQVNCTENMVHRVASRFRLNREDFLLVPYGESWSPTRKEYEPRYAAAYAGSHDTTSLSNWVDLFPQKNQDINNYMFDMSPNYLLDVREYMTSRLYSKLAQAALESRGEPLESLPYGTWLTGEREKAIHSVTRTGFPGWSERKEFHAAPIATIVAGEPQTQMASAQLQAAFRPAFLIPQGHELEPGFGRGWGW